MSHVTAWTAAEGAGVFQRKEAGVVQELSVKLDRLDRTGHVGSLGLLGQKERRATLG